MSFDFSEHAKNHLLINPRLSEDEKNIFLELQLAFEKKFGDAHYFLVPSSGSSKKADESVKLIALHRDAVLNSARRFNSYFQAGAADHWGLTVPIFHVAGLGIYARAFLAGSQVFDGMAAKEIKFISLVPTQVFDLVAKNQVAPPNIKKVLIGAGQLNPQLRQQAIDLNWPLVETYGMTETASMIAVKEDQALTAMPGVILKTENQLLKIKCDSLLTASIQKKQNTIQITEPVKDGFYQTEDQAEIPNNHLILKGRATEFIKIMGEGVSLAELKEKLETIALKRALPLAQVALLPVEDKRRGYQLILAVEKSVDSETIKQVVQEFNQKVRPYEKIQKIIEVQKIPLSDLGKIKSHELKELVLQTMQVERSR